MKLPWQRPTSPEEQPPKRPRRSASRRRGHLSGAEQKTLAEMVDAGHRDADIREVLGVNRSTLWRHKRELEEERAREQVEQLQVLRLQAINDSLTARIDAGDPVAWVIGLALLPRRQRLQKLAEVGTRLEVDDVEPLRAFNRWIEQWSREQLDHAVRAGQHAATAGQQPNSDRPSDGDS